MRSDDDLIGAFKAGDSSAMEALFRRYRRPVFAWLLRTVPDRADAEDLYQEVWLKVVRGIDGYSAGGFKAWLWRIVRNAAVDRARKKMAVPILDEPMSDEADAEASIDQVADVNAVSAFGRMEAEERDVRRQAPCRRDASGHVHGRARGRVHEPSPAARARGCPEARPVRAPKGAPAPRGASPPRRSCPSPPWDR